MAFYGNPDELDRLAAGLRAKAAHIRADAAAHETRGHAAHWVSDAAAAYREQLSRDRAGTDRQAAEIERAAALLAAHADEVRETLAAIARIEKQVTDWLADQRRSVVNAAERAADTARGVADTAGRVAGTAGGALRDLVSDVPFGLDDRDLPAPGDIRWLEVGRLLNRADAL